MTITNPDELSSMNYPLAKPRYYFSLAHELWQFIRQPKPERNLMKTTHLKICDTIGLYLLKMVCLIPLVLFFAVVYDPENVQAGRMSDRFSPWMMVLVGGFILPLVEEIAFRLSLRFKPIYLAMSAAVFTYYILTKLVFFTKISAVDDSFSLRILISMATGAVILLIVNFAPVKRLVVQFWERHFRLIYYLSCIVFAWIHIAKYELILLNVLLVPILTLPQLMSAVINGYTRVAFGFQYPLIFHISNNLIGIGLTLLSANDVSFY